ncbi:MAG TPA: glycoside hydrolase family 6 protein [Gemmatimonadaceae bacterium]|nr:glycoside hydrolase family 6 protein [Gemmatimonadaceae bacterium]
MAACSSDVLSPNNVGSAGGSFVMPAPAAPVPVTGNPIFGASFWVNPASSAKITADSWRASRPSDAAQMDKIAAHPQAQWFNGWSTDIQRDVSAAVGAVTAANALPVLVAYNIPQRDCGKLSAGGTTVEGYQIWISDFASGLAGRKAVIILEPDALSNMNCLSAEDQTTRVNLLQYAVQVLRAHGGIVYLDGGNSAWRSASDQAARLVRANVAAADGFALNVSSFQYTANSIAYGKSISAIIGGKHFIIDTSRNGLGPSPDNAWCNPDGRALGSASTTDTADPVVDAYLWVKTPGESDGSCGAAPAAGQWWADYALGLAQRSAL